MVVNAENTKVPRTQNQSSNQEPLQDGYLFLNKKVIKKIIECNKRSTEKSKQKCIKGVENYIKALGAQQNDQGGSNDQQGSQQGQGEQAKRKSSDENWPTPKKKGLNVKGSLTFWPNKYYNKWGQRLK